jgi:hypothetical protein
MTVEEHRPPATRLRQGIVLLAGAVLFALLLGDDGGPSSSSRSGWA